MAHFTIRMQPLPVFSDQQLRTLSMPIFVVVGARDVIFSSANLKQRLESCVPHARVLVLPGVGHGLTNQTANVLEALSRSAN